jgi:cytidine deaminase
MLDAACSARDLSLRTASGGGGGFGDGPVLGVLDGAPVRVGAALLARSGKVHVGAAVDLAGAGGGGGGEGGPAGIGMSAETVALVKALSEGDSSFEALFLASDSPSEHVFPSASAAQALLSYGDVDVYSARADRLIVRRRLSELVTAGRAGAASAAAAAAATSGDGALAGTAEVEGESHEAIFADVPVARWTVGGVLAWLDRAVGLPQYQHAFRECSVDGFLLLSLRETDLRHLLGVEHPLHRRKIEQGVRRLAARDAREQSAATAAAAAASAAAATAAAAASAASAAVAASPASAPQVRPPSPLRAAGAGAAALAAEGAEAKSVRFDDPKVRALQRRQLLEQKLQAQQRPAAPQAQQRAAAEAGKTKPFALAESAVPSAEAAATTAAATVGAAVSVAAASTAAASEAAAVASGKRPPLAPSTPAASSASAAATASPAALPSAAAILSPARSLAVSAARSSGGGAARGGLNASAVFSSSFVRAGFAGGDVAGISDSFGAAGVAGGDGGGGMLVQVDAVPLIEDAAALHADTRRLLHPQQVLRLYHAFLDASSSPSGTPSGFGGGGGSGGRSGAARRTGGVTAWGDEADALRSGPIFAAGPNESALSAQLLGSSSASGRRHLCGVEAPQQFVLQQPVFSGVGVAASMRPEEIEREATSTRLGLAQVAAASRRLGYAGPVAEEECRRLLLSRGVAGASGAGSSSLAFGAVAGSQNTDGLSISFSDFADFVAGVFQYAGAAHAAACGAAAKAAAVLAAQQQLAQMAQVQAAQVNALRASLGLQAGGASGMASPFAGGAESAFEGLGLRAVPVVDARGNVVYVAPVSASAGAAVRAGAGAGDASFSLPPMLGGGMGGLLGLPVDVLNASLSASGLSGLGRGGAFGFGAASLPPMRDGCTAPVAIHMVDGWAGPPGTDPWYEAGLDYDTYAVRVLRKHGSISEEVVLVPAALDVPADVAAEESDDAPVEKLNEKLRRAGAAGAASVSSIQSQDSRAPGDFVADEDKSGGKVRSAKDKAGASGASLPKAGKRAAAGAEASVREGPGGAPGSTPLSPAAGGVAAVKKPKLTLADTRPLEPGEVLAVGAAVIARRGGEQPPRAYPATVTGSRRRRDGSVSYVVEFSRGDEEADVPAKHLRVIFALEPKAKGRGDAGADSKSDAGGPTASGGGGSGGSGGGDGNNMRSNAAALQGDNEGRNNAEKVPAEPAASAGTTRSGGFAAAAVAAAGVVSLQRFYAGDVVEARFQGSRSFKRARVTDVRRERSTWLYDVRYDGPGSIRESGLPEYDVRREGEDAMPTPSSRQRGLNERAGDDSAVRTARESLHAGGKVDEFNDVSDAKNDPLETNLGPSGRDMDGRVLVAGDRVEAKYKGRGTKFFGGKVSLVRVVDGAVLLNLLYDDGDKEEGAVAANVRRLGGSRADEERPQRVFAPIGGSETEVRKVDDGRSAASTSLNLSRLSVSFADDGQERKVNGSAGSGGDASRSSPVRSAAASPGQARGSAQASRLAFTAPIFELGEEFEEELVIDESDIISGGGKRPEPERERPAGPIPR